MFVHTSSSNIRDTCRSVQVNSAHVYTQPGALSTCITSHDTKHFQIASTVCQNNFASRPFAEAANATRPLPIRCNIAASLVAGRGRGVHEGLFIARQNGYRICCCGRGCGCEEYLEHICICRRLKRPTPSVPDHIRPLGLDNNVDVIKSLDHGSTFN